MQVPFVKYVCIASRRGPKVYGWLSPQDLVQERQPVPEVAVEEVESGAGFDDVQHYNPSEHNNRVQDQRMKR